MLLKDVVGEVINNLARNRLRTALTMMGIVIGTLTIVIIWSLSSGLQQFLQRQFEFIATPTTIECFPPGGINLKKLQSLAFGSIGEIPRKVEESEKGEDGGFGNIRLVYFSQEQVDTLSSIPHVTKVSPAIMVPGKWIRLVGQKDGFEVFLAPWREDIPRYLVAGRGVEDSGQPEIILSQSYCQAFGVENPEELLGKAVEIKVGKHPFLQKYLESGLFGNSWSKFSKKLQKLFVAEDHGTKDVYSRTYIARVVGVISDNLFPAFTFLSQNLLQRMSRFFFHQPDLYTSQNHGLMVRVTVDAVENVPLVQQEINKKGMETATMQDTFASFKKLFWIVESILTLFGLIAFLVATLGIINTLLMAVYERKREIGILKSLGATRGNIRALFAVEAATIGFLGGCVGLILGVVLVIVGNYAAAHMYPLFWKASSLFQFHLYFIPMVLLFTSVIGLLGGLYPANKAANLEPIAALRYE